MFDDDYPDECIDCDRLDCICPDPDLWRDEQQLRDMDTNR